MAKPFIRRVLDLSTAHFTQVTLDALWAGDAPASIALEPGDDCAFVIVNVPPVERVVHHVGELHSMGHLNDPIDGERWPADLRAVALVARELGCDFIKIDRDGDVIDGLPVFDESA